MQFWFLSAVAKYRNLDTFLKVLLWSDFVSHFYSDTVVSLWCSPLCLTFMYTQRYMSPDFLRGKRNRCNTVTSVFISKTLDHDQPLHWSVCAYSTHHLLPARSQHGSFLIHSAHMERSTIAYSGLPGKDPWKVWKARMPHCTAMSAICRSHWQRNYQIPIHGAYSLRLILVICG
jgi:hypothetical protein